MTRQLMTCLAQEVRPRLVAPAWAYSLAHGFPGCPFYVSLYCSLYVK